MERAGKGRRELPKVTNTRAVGRPPAADSAETERRIILAARDAFAEYGYAGTTNQRIAALAGVATGTIYYYFESKQDLFIAALRDTRTIVLRELGKATQGATTFVMQLQQLLEAALALHERDPGLAAFSGASAIDVQRYPELREAAARGGVPDGSGVFLEMLSAARRRGEVPADLGDDAMAGMVDALLSGLAALASRTDPQPLRDAFAATARLLDGTLFGALAVTDA